MLEKTWTMTVGDRWTRAEQMERYGGGPRGGIVPSTTTPNLFIYSDIESGDPNGYVHDGWTPDNAIYKYTGKGRIGDQQMAGPNASILNHEMAGRALRVFVADGKVPGSDTTIQQYIGEFVLDQAKPWEWDDAPDRTGAMRKVIVFRLVPVGEKLIRGQDEALSPGTGNVTIITDLEALRVDSFTSGERTAVTALRREATLVQRYGAWLLRTKGAGPIVRQRIRLAGGGVLYTDGWVRETGELIEAKAEPRRNDVRLALGQLLDYSHFLDPTPTSMTLLVGKKPRDDMIELLAVHGVGVVYEHRTGRFVRA